MKDCYTLDKYGAFKMNIILEGLGRTLTDLDCVNNNKINLTEIYYPLLLNDSNLDRFLKKIKVAIDAKKNNLNFINIMPKLNSQEYPIVIFDDNEDNYNKSVLYAYIALKYDKEFSKDMNPMDYILNNLKYNDIHYNDYFYMSRYINFIVPEILPEKTMKIMENPNITQKQKYMAKYRLIKKYDNFKDFNKKYKNIKAEAGKILEKTKKSKDFINYIKTVKTHKFDFTIKQSVGDNPLYKKIKPAVENYAKKLNVKI